MRAQRCAYSKILVPSSSQAEQPDSQERAEEQHRQSVGTFSDGLPLSSPPPTPPSTFPEEPTQVAVTSASGPVRGLPPAPVHATGSGSGGMETTRMPRSGAAEEPTHSSGKGGQKKGVVKPRAVVKTGNASGSRTSERVAQRQQQQQEQRPPQPQYFGAVSATVGYVHAAAGPSNMGKGAAGSAGE